MDNGNKMRVNKKNAIQTVKQNLENHRKEYQEQVVDYRKAYMIWLKNNLNHLETGGKVEDIRKELQFDLPYPKNHEKDYESAIDYLTWAESEDSDSVPDFEKTLMIDRNEFNTWIRNQWQWQFDFSNNSVLYKSASFASHK